jgi:hypothetical protein
VGAVMVLVLLSMARGHAPAASADLAATRLYLPVVLRGYPPQVSENGGFESGSLSGWQQGGGLNRAVVTDITHTGLYAARLGNPEAAPCQAPKGEAWIEQQLAVPTGGVVTLSAWYRLFTYDFNPDLVDPIDLLDVALDGRRILLAANRSSAARCEGQPYDLGWQRFAYDMGAYRGQTVSLRIRLTTTDDWYSTWAYIDDVAVGDIVPLPTNTLGPTATPGACAEPGNNARQGACGPLLSGQVYRDYISSSADQYDWFYFDMPVSHAVEAWLTEIPAGNDYELYLMDADGTMLQYSANRGSQDEHILWGPGPAGRYYLVVPADNGGWNADVPYALRVEY